MHGKGYRAFFFPSAGSCSNLGWQTSQAFAPKLTIMVHRIMKPAIALSFSENGPSPHHLSDGDWYCIGTVPLHAPDPRIPMHTLRDQGFALENDLSCKVIIPADQVRLLTVETEGLDPDAALRKIKAILGSATPYGLSELAYVTTLDGAETHLAAVARQTLDDASAFAVDHGFIPEFIPEAVRASATDRDATGGDALSEPSRELPAAPAENASPGAASTPKSGVSETASPPEIPVHAIAGAAETPAFDPAPEALVPAPASGTDLKRFARAAIAASVLLGLGVWSFNSADPEGAVGEPEVAAPVIAEPQSEPVEAIFDQPETTTTFRAFTGSAPVEPSGLSAPPEPGLVGIPLPSVTRSNLSTGVVAPPPVSSLDTDAPLVPIASPGPVGQLFDLDERGMIAPGTEETLNPAAVMVYSGRPSWVPPEPPPRFGTEPAIEEDVDDRLAAIRPRPDTHVDHFERQQPGGRSRTRLAPVRPRPRPKPQPESLPVKPRVDETPDGLAVLQVPRPRMRPAHVAAQAAKKPGSGGAPLEATANVAASTVEAGSFQPKAVKPEIPTTASVARQATIDNAINLRKFNLIGVYGTPTNRRALVRLPGGRYKKLKVGDRIDGGNVVAIGDSELRYQKRGKNVTLRMPRG